MASAPPTVLLLCGPSLMGKTHMVECVLGIQYDVLSERADGLCNTAARNAGLDQVGVPATMKSLSDGSLPKAAVERYYEEHDAAVGDIFDEAKRYKVTPVLEGYTLMFEKETQSVIRVARKKFGKNVRVVRAFVRADYPTWLSHLVYRAEERNKKEVRVSALGRPQWEKRITPPTPVKGIEERTIANIDELHELAGEFDIPRHRWYQGFKIGSIEVKAMTDAHEKVAAIDEEDVKGKTVIDLCCATAVTSFLLKERGAKSVTAIESNPRRVGKAQELAKILRRQAGFPRRGVKIILGDAFKRIKKMNADTVVILGALHYFEDYNQILETIAPAAKQALYVEVLLTDRGKGKAEPPATDVPDNFTTFDRARGSTIYAPDTPTFARVAREALPEFELAGRVPSQGLGEKGPDTYREVWAFRRKGKAAKAAGAAS